MGSTQVYGYLDERPEITGMPGYGELPWSDNGSPFSTYRERLDYERYKCLMSDQCAPPMM